tara:strand:+ start:61 stop:609 length:549 start_codon:yes stop_codon:yes gene_type:complete
MDAKKAIFNRRTIHFFENKKVSENIIKDSIEAANQAPCHRFTFPWRFYSVSLKKRKQILDLAIEIKSKKKQIDENAENIIKEKYLNPSHLLITSQILNKEPTIQKEDYAACSCAIQNLSISLASDGVFSKWSTGAITKNPKTYEIIGLNAKIEEIIGFIWIGYGKNLPKITRPLIDQIYKEI